MILTFVSIASIAVIALRSSVSLFTFLIVGGTGVERGIGAGIAIYNAAGAGVGSGADAGIGIGVGTGAGAARPTHWGKPASVLHSAHSVLRSCAERHFVVQTHAGTLGFAALKALLPLCSCANATSGISTLTDNNIEMEVNRILFTLCPPWKILCNIILSYNTALEKKK